MASTVSKVVATIATRPQFARFLHDALLPRGVTVVDLPSSDLEMFQCSLHEPVEFGDWISIGGIEVPAHALAASYSEGYIDRKDRSFDEAQVFRDAEVSAAIAFVRQCCGTPLNPPWNGSIGPFADSLPVQWEAMRNPALGVSAPRWTLTQTSEVTPDTLIIRNPYCYQYNQATETARGGGSEKRPVIALMSPLRGAHFLVIFIGDRLFAVLDNGSGWSPLNLRPILREGIRSCVIASRRHFGIDIGQLELFFDGSLTFWSVCPYPCPWYLKDDELTAFKVALAEFTMH